METPEWYKIKGYYHISPQLSGDKNSISINVSKIKNENYVGNYAFFPLLHVNIKERKYKKHPQNPKIRSHSLVEDDKVKKTTKIRPLHYANHTDALIYSYYAHILNIEYENTLLNEPGLSDCITAYRKIPIEQTDKNKGTIHFAHEAFSEIKKRANENGDCSVLAFDIKSFFSSLNHTYLKEKWENLLGVRTLPKSHLNVFNSATNFSLIYKDDLRRFNKIQGRKSEFDEKKLSSIRNKEGFKAFFSSPKEFKNTIKCGKLRVYKNNFKDKNTGEVIGIPQGLPISAILANLYLLDFDKAILNNLVKTEKCYYRRYSDDIVIIGDTDKMKLIEDFVMQEMEKCFVQISKEKTEKFIFKKIEEKVVSHKIVNEELIPNLPFIYLGFEFYGHKTLIKSANLSKFYRRMIYSIKKKCNRAKKLAEKNGNKPIIYKRQLYKIYRNINLDKSKSTRKFNSFEKLETGEYRIISNIKNKPFQGNYFSYAKRSAEIMNEPAILKQIEGEKRVFNQAIQKHLNN